MQEKNLKCTRESDNNLNFNLNFNSNCKKFKFKNSKNFKT